MLSEQPKPSILAPVAQNADPRSRRLSASFSGNASFSDTSFEQEAYDPELEFQNQRKPENLNIHAAENLSHHSGDTGYISETPMSAFSQGSFSHNQDNNKGSFDITNTGLTPGLTPAMTPNMAGSNFQFPPPPNQFNHGNNRFNNQPNDIAGGFGAQGNNNFDNFGSNGSRNFRGHDNFNHHKEEVFNNPNKIDFTKPPPNFNSNNVPPPQNDRNFHRQDSGRYHDRHNYRNRDRRDSRDNHGYDRTDRGGRGGRDWRKDRNDRGYDRDFRENRYEGRNRDYDNSYNRRDRHGNRRDDRERDFNHDKMDRNYDNRNNRMHDRLFDNRNSLDFDNRDPRSFERELGSKPRGDNLRRESMEKEQPPPPRPQTPPMPPEPTPTEEEPRPQSLESRIQSLLQNVGGISDGFGSPSDESTSDSRKKEQTPPSGRYNNKHGDLSDRIPKTPKENCVDAQNPRTPFDYGQDYTPASLEGERIDRKLTHNLDFRESNSHLNGSALTNFTPDSIPVAPTGTSEDITQDDDEMSISSGNSDDQNIEVNPIPDVTVSDVTNSANFVANPWQMQNMGMNFGTNFQNYNFMGANNMQVYNQNFYNQYNNDMMNQSPMIGQTKAESEAMEKKFRNVLEGFVKELKSVMQKDMCKKMVENSAFQSFDSWWSDESSKHKQVVCVRKENC